MLLKFPVYFLGLHVETLSNRRCIYFLKKIDWNNMKFNLYLAVAVKEDMKTKFSRRKKLRNKKRLKFWRSRLEN